MEAQRGAVPCPRSVSYRAWVSPKGCLILKPVPFVHVSAPGQTEGSNSGLQVKSSHLSCPRLHLSTICGAISVLMDNSPRTIPPFLPLGSRSFKLLQNLMSCEKGDFPKKSLLPMRRRKLVAKGETSSFFVSLSCLLEYGLKHGFQCQNGLHLDNLKVSLAKPDKLSPFDFKVKEQVS